MSNSDIRAIIRLSAYRVDTDIDGCTDSQTRKAVRPYRKAELVGIYQATHTVTQQAVSDAVGVASTKAYIDEPS